MTYMQWHNSRAKYLLNTIPSLVVEWINVEDMSDKEKENHPTYKTTGGYLKVKDEMDSRQEWWNGLSKEDKNEIISIPNFDAAIFKECTGIDVTGE